MYRPPPSRVAQGKDLRDWSLGIRLGARASGAWADTVMVKTQPLPPPVLCTIGWREMVQILKAPHQLGLTPSTNTASKSGWAVYSYMAPEILPCVCELGVNALFVLGVNALFAILSSSY